MVEGWLDGARVAGLAPLQVGIEGRGDDAGERSSGGGHGHPMSIQVDETIGDVGGEGVDVVGEGGSGEAMAAGDGGHVDGERAHQLLDDLAARPVVFAEDDAAADGQPAGGDRFAIVPERGGVLGVAVGQGTDGRGAETEQDRCLVGGVTLEVAMQAVSGQCSRQIVVGTGEMVEADGDDPSPWSSVAAAVAWLKRSAASGNAASSMSF